jgi:hypothetical protein
MREDPQEWFKTAIQDLEAAQILFLNKKYQQAIFYLQQANEKVSKGLLIRIGFLPEYKESEYEKELKKVIGIYPSTPRIYGHAWHTNLLKVLEVLLNAVDSLTSSIMKIKFTDRKTVSNIQQFRKSIPSWRAKLNRARKVKPNPNPSLQEIEAVVKACNQMLNSSIAAQHRVIEKVGKIKLPDKNAVIASVEKHFGMKLDQETFEKLNEVVSRKPAEIVKNVVTLPETLIVLALLNTYLLPHEYISRYPEPKMDFVYNEEFSLVKMFNEISNLIRKCCEFAAQTD